MAWGHRSICEGVLPDCCIAMLKIIPRLARKVGCKWIWLLINAPNWQTAQHVQLVSDAGIIHSHPPQEAPLSGVRVRTWNHLTAKHLPDKPEKKNPKKKTTEIKSRECLLLAAGHLSASQKEWLNTIMNPIKQEAIYGGFRDNEPTGKLS